MTREEAITLFQKEIECTKHDNCTDCPMGKDYCDAHLYLGDYRIDLKYISAFNMAIQALEQQPCKDAISRQKVLEEMELRNLNGDAITKGFVKSLPSVQPIRKRGKWIVVDDTHSQCDQCHAVFEIVSVYGEANFCPNCGSDNREDGE